MRLSVLRSSSALRRLVTIGNGDWSSMRWNPKERLLCHIISSRLSSSQLSTLNNDGANASTASSDALLRITPEAAQQLRRIAGAGEHLRVSVDSGGCSGFEYKLALDNVINPDDEIIEKDGARVVVDQLSLGFVRGSKLDFLEDLMRSTFRIIDNPAATQGCSCGASFAPKSME